jgi:hypothetical protein
MFVPATVVETPEFLSAARKLMSDSDRAQLIDYLAYHPAAGDLIQGTGGVRKLRWALAGRGKSGGARVIYFYHNIDMPLYVLSAYAKNERSNLNQQDRNDMQKLAEMLTKSHRRKRI